MQSRERERERYEEVYLLPLFTPLQLPSLSLSLRKFKLFRSIIYALDAKNKTHEKSDRKRILISSCRLLRHHEQQQER